MPVRYRIGPEHRLIRTNCYGDVTTEECVQHFRMLASDPLAADELDVFLDLSEASTIPLNFELMRIVDAMQTVRSRVRFGACAILVANAPLFGMMRVFEVFAEKLFRVVRTFRDREQAEAWLASQRMAEKSAD